MINNITSLINSDNSTMLFTSNPIIVSIGGIIAGALVILLGQIIIKFFLNPIIEYHNVINEIKYALIYYADIIDNPGTPGIEDEIKEGKTHLRHLSSLLRVKTSHVPLYKYLKKIKVVEKSENILTISQNLIGMSNALNNKGDKDKIDKWNEEILKILYPNKNKNMSWKDITGLNVLVSAVLTVILSLIFFPLSFLGPITGGFLLSYFTKGYKEYYDNEKNGVIIGAISGLIGGLIIGLLLILSFGDINAVMGLIYSKIGIILGNKFTGYTLIEISIIVSFFLGVMGGIIGIIVKK